MTFRFECLQIWHDARRFSDRVYKIVVRFPEVEKFGLTSQMIRAANSVGLNIAEGAGRDTDTGFNRFLGIAVGPIFEVASASFIALDQGYITPYQQRALYTEAQKLARSINSFRRTLNKKSKR